MGLRIVRTTKSYIYHPVDLHSRLGMRLRRWQQRLDKRKTNRYMARLEKHLAVLSPHDRCKLAIELVKRKGVTNSMSQNQCEDLVRHFKTPWSERV